MGFPTFVSNDEARSLIATGWKFQSFRDFDRSMFEGRRPRLNLEDHEVKIVELTLESSRTENNLRGLGYSLLAIPVLGLTLPFGVLHFLCSGYCALVGDYEASVTVTPSIKVDLKKTDQREHQVEESTTTNEEGMSEHVKSEKDTPFTGKVYRRTDMFVSETRNNVAVLANLGLFEELQPFQSKTYTRTVLATNETVLSVFQTMVEEGEE